MGQKVNPVGIRLGIVRDWTSRWYADRVDYPTNLEKDLEARKYLEKELYQAAVSRIDIERTPRNAKVTIHAARPGVIIGKKGGGVEDLKAKLTNIMGVAVHVVIEEIRKPELDATLVAQSVAQQLEHRIMFRRAMKRAVTNAMKLGAQGIKICVSGRLGGAEIARCEWYREGRVPLHTFRADIDYGTANAHTTYGVIGVKVWIFHKEVNPKVEKTAEGAGAVA